MSKVEPDGWSKSRLGDYVGVQGGNAFKSEDFTDSGVPIIRISNIKKDGSVDLDKSVYTIADDSLSRFEVSDGDILIAMSGATTGKVGRFRSNSYAYLNQRVGRFFTKKASVISLCFVHQITSEDSFVNSILIDAIGGAQPNISNQQIESIPIALPPLPEQKKIAAILSSVDDVIEKTQAQINKLKDLKTGMMQELLSPREGTGQPQGVGDNGKGHTEFKDSPIGRIPVGWDVKSLGEIYPKIVVGYVGNVNDHYCDQNVGVPFYRTLNIRDGFIRHEPIKYVTKTFNDKNKKSQIYNEDILIARVGANLGMTCKVTGITSSANIANTIIIKSNKAACSDFYMEYIRSEFGQKQIQSAAAGGAQSVFNTKLAFDLVVPFPPISEQLEIAKKLSAIDNCINSIGAKIAKTKSIKKALMQDLLTGKVRVAVPSHPCDHGMSESIHVKD